MQISVLGELRQPVGSVFVFDLTEGAVRLDDAELRELVGTLKMFRTNRGLLVTLDARAVMREPCARCLVASDCPIQIQFEEEYVPILDANSGARLHVDTADDGFHIGPDFVVDLREPLRQYVLMSEPLKPLCRPDCAGLCPACGADLNAGPCECVPQADERWGVLAGFEAKTTKGK